MRPQKLLGGVFLSFSLVLGQSCWLKKEPRKATIVIPPAPQPEAPKQLPPPPSLPASASVPTLKGQPELPTLPPPAAKVQSKRSKQTQRSSGSGTLGSSGNNPSATPVPSGSIPSASAAAEPGVDPSLAPLNPTLNPNPQASPSLQPILATQEVAERTKRIQQYLDRARVVVLRAERNKPDQKAKELIGQVRTFIQQAEESRKNDLVRAENLAERAEVLSRALR